MSKLLLILILLSPWFRLPAEAVSVEQAIEETRQDVRKSTEELNRLRDQIRDKRVPLAAELEQKRMQVAELRKQVEEIRASRNLRQEERSLLRGEVEQLEAEKEFVASVFQEYRRSLETRIPPAEIQVVHQRLPAENDSPWAPIPDWLDLRQGGYRFDGEALDPDGRERSGQFVVFGPLGYFTDGEIAGMVTVRPGSSLPGLYPLTQSEDIAGLQEVLAGGSARLPLDVSGGDALRVLEAKPGWIEHLKQGGAVVIPLLMLGGLAILLALRKVFDLSRLTVKIQQPEKEKLQKLSESDPEAILQDFAAVPQPLNSLLVAGVQHRKASREHLEEILHEHVLAVVPRLESSLGMLAVLGGVAPLLGLLGTVTGMIHTFQLVTLFGSGNSQTLSGGISEALVTTELGLVIAIPILLVHAWLARKSKILLGELEQSGVTVVNLLKSSPEAGP